MDVWMIWWMCFKKKRNNLFLNSDLYYTSLYFIHTFMISSTIQHSIDIYLRHIAGYIRIIKKSFCDKSYYITHIQKSRQAMEEIWDGFFACTLFILHSGCNVEGFINVVSSYLPLCFVDVLLHDFTRGMSI